MPASTPMCQTWRNIKSTAQNALCCSVWYFVCEVCEGAVLVKDVNPLLPQRQVRPEKVLRLPAPQGRERERDSACVRVCVCVCVRVCAYICVPATFLHTQHTPHSAQTHVAASSNSPSRRRNAIRLDRTSCTKHSTAQHNSEEMNYQCVASCT